VIVELPDHIQVDGDTGHIAAFTCLVLPKSGGFEIFVPVTQGALTFEDENWLAVQFDGPKAAAFGAQLEVFREGGGSA
jgi:hypothetical protein